MTFGFETDYFIAGIRHDSFDMDPVFHQASGMNGLLVSNSMNLPTSKLVIFRRPVVSDALALYGLQLWLGLRAVETDIALVWRMSTLHTIPLTCDDVIVQVLR